LINSGYCHRGKDIFSIVLQGNDFVSLLVFVAAVTFQISTFDANRITSISLKLAYIQQLSFFERFDALVEYACDELMFNPLFPLSSNTGVMNFGLAAGIFFNWQHFPLLAGV